MAKLTRDELDRVRGEELEVFLSQRRYRVATTPFGALQGQAVIFIGRSVPWKRRGHPPRGLAPQP